MSALVEQVERLDLNVGEVKPCGACHAGKGKTEFSSKQWHLKTDARRRCSECVASGKPLVEMAAAASPPTQPVGGGQWVPPPGPPPAPNPDYPDLTAEYEAEMGFHEINLRYPGLQLIHRNPLVFIVNGFFTDDECDRVVKKCHPNMKRSVLAGEEAAGRGSMRTSTMAALPRAECPTLVAKMRALLAADDDAARAAMAAEGDSRLESLQIIRYERGQYFQPHCDGVDGLCSHSGFVESRRLVTAFVYLADSAAGGATRFTSLGLEVRPKKGQAVVHFPTVDVGLQGNFRRDGRTAHESVPAEDEKWILATWMWAHSHAGKLYVDSKLPKLSPDVI